MKLIDVDAAIEAVEFGITYAKAIDTKTGEVRELFKQNNEELRKAVERIKALPSVQPDAVTASLEELINDYGEDGYFIVDGVNYQANELLNELKINSSVGEKFRIQIIKTIVAYFMKFGD